MKNKKIQKVCGWCGQSFLGDGRTKYCSPIHGYYARYSKNHKDRKDTLCWDCANACGNCSWSRSFTPVKGWTANPTKIVDTHGRVTDSFHIIQCPEYKKGRSTI